MVVVFNCKTILRRMKNASEVSKMHALKQRYNQRRLSTDVSWTHVTFGSASNNAIVFFSGNIRTCSENYKHMHGHKHRTTKAQRESAHGLCKTRSKTHKQTPTSRIVPLHARINATIASEFPEQLLLLRRNKSEDVLEMFRHKTKLQNNIVLSVVVVGHTDVLTYKRTAGKTQRKLNAH